MKVEIWPDIVCPSCNNCKRKFEKAPDGFSAKDKVEVAWRNFQVDPVMEYVPAQSEYGYLGKRKETTTIEGKIMSDALLDIAIEAGFKLNFDKAIINNTMNAQRSSE